MNMAKLTTVIATTAFLIGIGPVAADPDSGAGTTGAIPGDSRPVSGGTTKVKPAPMMKKTVPDGAGENKQTPTGGQPGGGTDKS